MKKGNVPDSPSSASWQQEGNQWVKKDRQSSEGGDTAGGAERTQRTPSWKASRTSWIKEDKPSASVHDGEEDNKEWNPKLVSDPDRPLAKLLTKEQLERLCRHLPKVELHAHLSGTVQESTLRELLEASGGDTETARFSLDSLSTTDSWEKTWNETVEAFATIRKLTASDRRVFHRIVMEAVQKYAKDGCVYYEMRTGLKNLPDRKTFLSELVALLKTAQGKFDIICRLLVSVDRGASIEDAKETIDIAIEAFENQNKEHGLLVGVEMGGNPLVGDFAELQRHFQRARDVGLKVSLHFAENQGQEIEHHQILDFGPERVGHAVFMSSEVTSKLLRLQIPVETCPTCHEAYYKVPVERNIFGTLWPKRHAVVLCCDNSCMLRTSIGKEYAKIIKAFDLSARDLEILLLSSIPATFADEKTKRKLETIFKSKISLLLPALKKGFGGQLPESLNAWALTGVVAAAVFGVFALSVLKRRP